MYNICSEQEGYVNKIIGIKAISFDGDGTLWDFEKVMRHSLHHVLKELEKIDPRTATTLDVEKMIKIRNRVANELESRAASLNEIRLEAFRQTLKNIGKPSDALAHHLNQIYRKHRFEDIELFESVLPTLRTLRTKYTLGLLSNGNTHPERCGLEDMFQFVIFAQAYGVEKPDSKLFQIAVEKAGCSKQELLHVGDSLQDDIRGAKNADIKSVWLNRKGIENDCDLEIDYEISSLIELLDIL